MFLPRGRRTERIRLARTVTRRDCRGRVSLHTSASNGNTGVPSNPRREPNPTDPRRDRQSFGLREDPPPPNHRQHLPRATINLQTLLSTRLYKRPLLLHRV